MTTTITLETHVWPVEVRTSDNHRFFTPNRASEGWAQAREFVPANTKRQFHITDSSRIEFVELPKEATGLHDHNSLIALNAACDNNTQSNTVAPADAQKAAEG